MSEIRQPEQAPGDLSELSQEQWAMIVPLLAKQYPDAEDALFKDMWAALDPNTRQYLFKIATNDPATMNDLATSRRIPETEK